MVEEVNIHQQPPQIFEDVFNAQKIINSHIIYRSRQNNDGEWDEFKLYANQVKIQPDVLNIQYTNTPGALEGTDFYIAGRYSGEIKSIENNIITVTKEDDDDKPIITKYSVERALEINNIFKNFIF